MLFPDWSNNLDCDGKSECGAPVPQSPDFRCDHRVELVMQRRTLDMYVMT